MQNLPSGKENLILLNISRSLPKLALILPVISGRFPGKANSLPRENRLYLGELTSQREFVEEGQTDLVGEDKELAPRQDPVEASTTSGPG